MNSKHVKQQTSNMELTFFYNPQFDRGVVVVCEPLFWNHRCSGRDRNHVSSRLFLLPCVLFGLLSSGGFIGHP